MQNVNIRNEIIDVLASCGLIWLEEDDDLSIDMDSLQWVSFVVELEEHFDIVLEDEVLVKNNISLVEMVEIVEQCLLNR